MLAPRVCVYTVMMGGYDALLDQPIAHESSADFLCFTDEPGLGSETWRVVPEARALLQDPARSSRRAKILGHELVRQYDVSLYIDASVLLLQTPEQLVADWLTDDVDMALVRHSYRAQVVDEFDAVLEEPLDDPARIHEQLLHYAVAHPDVLSIQPCWGAMLVRRHTPAVDRAMQTWWEHVLRYSRRDQLSLMVALTENDLAYRALELDNFESPYHRWPVAPGRRQDMRRGRLTPSGPLVAEVRRQALRIAELEELLAAEVAAGEQTRLRLRRARRRLRKALGAEVRGH